MGNGSVMPWLMRVRTRTSGTPREVKLDKEMFAFQAVESRGSRRLYGLAPPVLHDVGAHRSRAAQEPLCPTWRRIPALRGRRLSRDDPSGYATNAGLVPSGDQLGTSIVGPLAPGSEETRRWLASRLVTDGLY